MVVRKQCIDCTAQGITTKRKAPKPGPRCVTHHRAKLRNRRNYNHSTHIEETYDITADEYRLIYEYQGGCCYICQRAKGTYKRLSVDHCHATGLVRGLLCQPCNRLLGHFRDDPAPAQRVIDYLENPPAVDVIGVRITPDMRE